MVCEPPHQKDELAFRQERQVDFRGCRRCGRKASYRKTIFSYEEKSYLKLTYAARNELVRKAHVKKENDFLKETVLTPQAKVLFYLIHFLDAEQRLIPQEFRSASDELIHYRFYSYDNIGNLEKIEVCNPNGSVAFEFSSS